PYTSSCYLCNNARLRAHRVTYRDFFTRANYRFLFWIKKLGLWIWKSISRSTLLLGRECDPYVKCLRSLTILHPKFISLRERKFSWSARRGRRRGFSVGRRKPTGALTMTV